MTAINLEAVRRDITASSGEAWQSLVDLGYDRWQEEKDWGTEEMVQFCKLVYGEVVELAVLLGKYHQQVCNGGHSQYFDNGVSGTHEHYPSYDYNVPLTRRLEVLMKKFQLHTTSYGAPVADCVQDFINRHYSWEKSSDRDAIFNEWGETDDNDFPDTEDLDDAYYKVSDNFEHEMKRYFSLWLEFGEDPIATGRF